jgi:dTMP kinase
METIDQIADWVHGDTWPDLTILLDAPVEIGMERAGTRSAPDRIEQERHDFFERVRECYLQIALREPERFVVIDTTRSIDEVRADIAMLAEQILYLPSL